MDKMYKSIIYIQIYRLAHEDIDLDDIIIEDKINYRFQIQIN